jgi:6-phosphogluconolactonase (cycloisomerase 2 family)
MGIAIVPSGRFAYVVNSGTSNLAFWPASNISTYAIDARTGALAPLPGPPSAAGKQPFAIAVDPLGRFVYVAHLYTNNVSGYKIDTRTGLLAPVPGSPFPAGGDPISVAVDPAGKFVYVANQRSGNVSAYTIDARTGTLTNVPGSPFPTTRKNSDWQKPTYVTVDPSGRFVYVAISAEISAFAIDGETGALTMVPGSPFLMKGEPHSIAVDPSGRFVYVANYYAKHVSAYAIDGHSGALTPVTGSPFPAGKSPHSVAIGTTRRN